MGVVAGFGVSGVLGFPGNCWWWVGYLVFGICLGWFVFWVSVPCGVV